MSIRIANGHDVAKINSLVLCLSHFYLENNKGELPEWFAETLTEHAFSERISSQEFQHFVYEVEGEIVGYLALKAGSHLYHLFVSEQHQGKGIAKSLWQYARKVCVADIYTLRSSLFAIPIYQSFGFKVVGEVGEKDGIGFQSMQLRV